MADRREDSAIGQAASTAHTAYGALKTGKAIAAAAKGASAAGPYGAVAGALWGSRHHIGKIIAVIAFLLLLPVLFILMLPSVIFGGLTGSGTSSSALPILNDNSAITENINDISFTINQILDEGIDDVEARIAQDFAGTDGDKYEVVNPYEGNLVSNANLILSQYCAAKNQDWEHISISELEQVLRTEKNLFIPSAGHLKCAVSRTILKPRRMRAVLNSGTSTP